MNLKIRLKDRWLQLLRSMGVNTYLCASCKYNNPRDCRHRTRPYATICEDHVRK
ncbi:MAG: hypothetical protein ACO1SX_18810 [Actinomycetota bacterium]